VLFVRRVHYVAHPRHNGQIVRRLDNEDAIYAHLEATAQQPGARFTLANGLFSAMSVGQQLQLVQDACVITGAHGAGLSHVLFAPLGAHMLELRPPAFQRPHFIAYSVWAGATHHDWLLTTSAPPVESVLDRLHRVLGDAQALQQPATVQQPAPQQPEGQQQQEQMQRPRGELARSVSGDRRRQMVPAQAAPPGQREEPIALPAEPQPPIGRPTLARG
jgi:hypothetical protein